MPLDPDRREIPGRHTNEEADHFADGSNRPSFWIEVRAWPIAEEKRDIMRVFPEWVDVQGPTPFVLEGVIEEEVHVSGEDWPTNHYTFDFVFKVLPDPPGPTIRTGCLFMASDARSLRWTEERGEVEAPRIPPRLRRDAPRPLPPPLIGAESCGATPYRA